MHKDDKDEQDFINSVTKAYKKYCSSAGLKNDEARDSNNQVQRVAEERIKENTFIGTLILYSLRRKHIQYIIPKLAIFSGVHIVRK